MDEGRLKRGNLRFMIEDCGVGDGEDAWKWGFRCGLEGNG